LTTSLDGIQNSSSDFQPAAYRFERKEVGVEGEKKGEGNTCALGARRGTQTKGPELGELKTSGTV
jgi:hypothetical protein